MVTLNFSEVADAVAEGRLKEYHIEQDKRRLEEEEEDARELERQANLSPNGLFTSRLILVGSLPI